MGCRHQEGIFYFTGESPALPEGFFKKNGTATSIPNNFSIHPTIYLLP
jgi:hypothetical protein